MTKKAAIITTVNHNVGDDFVREGIKYLLTSTFPEIRFDFSHIHKHSPITSTFGFEWLRDNRFGRRIDRFLPLSILPDRIKEADLIIQSGAPVYWALPSDNSFCNENEWYHPLLKRRWKLNPNAKFINLAGGTCQPYFSDGSEFSEFPGVVNYIKELTVSSSLTTVRDQLAGKVLNSLGFPHIPVIPCSSIFAVDYHKIKPGKAEYIVFNYMHGGSHFELGQKINNEQWKQTALALYYKLKSENRIVFSCHNKKEANEVKAIFPDADCFFSSDYMDYMYFYSKAKFGIMNRVHGAFLMASLGKPSIIIGNDTRARMGNQIGLNSFFVNEATLPVMNNELEILISSLGDFPDKIRSIKEKAYENYKKFLLESEIL